MSPSALVQQMYAAFGRGDIPAILNQLAENVEWDAVAPSTDVPWLQPRCGRAQVAEFFTALDALRFEIFNPKAILEHGRMAVAIVDVTATVTATGRKIVEEDEAHIWHFNEQGLVTRFRHRVDTHLQLLAWRGE